MVSNRLFDQLLTKIQGKIFIEINKDLYTVLDISRKLIDKLKDKNTILGNDDYVSVTWRFNNTRGITERLDHVTIGLKVKNNLMLQLSMEGIEFSIAKNMFHTK